jgi:16S rRNA processing protein RimM
MVDESTINTLFVIDHQGTELLLPAQEEFIVNIDHEQRVMEVQVPDGLLQMEEAEEV